MNIEQTCKVTLSAEEVRQALTDFIRSMTKYRSNWRPYDECVAFETVTRAGRIDSPTCVVVLWGEAPEPVEEPIEAAPAAATAAIVPPSPTTSPFTTSKPAF